MSRDGARKIQMPLLRHVFRMGLFWQRMDDCIFVFSVNSVFLFIYIIFIVSEWCLKQTKIHIYQWYQLMFSSVISFTLYIHSYIHKSLSSPSCPLHEVYDRATFDHPWITAQPARASSSDWPRAPSLDED